MIYISYRTLTTIGDGIGYTWIVSLVGYMLFSISAASTEHAKSRGGQRFHKAIFGMAVFCYAICFWVPFFILCFPLWGNYPRVNWLGDFLAGGGLLLSL